MAITYKWNFNNLECLPTTNNNLQNIVVRVLWDYTGSDGQFNSSRNGVLDLDISNSNNFIPFANLTENVVKSWVTSKISETDLQKQISLSFANKDCGKTINLTPPWISSNT